MMAKYPIEPVNLLREGLMLTLSSGKKSLLSLETCKVTGCF